MDHFRHISSVKRRLSIHECLEFAESKRLSSDHNIKIDMFPEKLSNLSSGEYSKAWALFIQYMDHFRHISSVKRRLSIHECLEFAESKVCRPDMLGERSFLDDMEYYLGSTSIKKAHLLRDSLSSNNNVESSIPIPPPLLSSLPDPSDPSMPSITACTHSTTSYLNIKMFFEAYEPLSLPQSSSIQLLDSQPFMPRKFTITSLPDKPITYLHEFIADKLFKYILNMLTIANMKNEIPFYSSSSRRSHFSDSHGRTDISSIPSPHSNESEDSEGLDVIVGDDQRSRESEGYVGLEYCLKQIGPIWIVPSIQWNSSRLIQTPHPNPTPKDTATAGERVEARAEGDRYLPHQHFDSHSHSSHSHSAHGIVSHKRIDIMVPDIPRSRQEHMLIRDIVEYYDLEQAWRQNQSHIIKIRDQEDMIKKQKQSKVVKSSRIIFSDSRHWESIVKKREQTLLAYLTYKVKFDSEMFISLQKIGKLSQLKADEQIQKIINNYYPNKTMRKSSQNNQTQPSLKPSDGSKYGVKSNISFKEKETSIKPSVYVKRPPIRHLKWFDGLSTGDFDTTIDHNPKRAKSSSSKKHNQLDDPPSLVSSLSSLGTDSSLYSTYPSLSLLLSFPSFEITQPSAKESMQLVHELIEIGREAWRERMRMLEKERKSGYIRVLGNMEVPQFSSLELSSLFPPKTPASNPFAHGSTILSSFSSESPSNVNILPSSSTKFPSTSSTFPSSSSLSVSSSPIVMTYLDNLHRVFFKQHFEEGSFGSMLCLLSSIIMKRRKEHPNSIPQIILRKAVQSEIGPYEQGSIASPIQFTHGSQAFDDYSSSSEEHTYIAPQHQQIGVTTFDEPALPSMKSRFGSRTSRYMTSTMGSPSHALHHPNPMVSMDEEDSELSINEFGMPSPRQNASSPRSRVDSEYNPYDYSSPSIADVLKSHRRASSQLLERPKVILESESKIGVHGSPSPSGYSYPSSYFSTGEEERSNLKRRTRSLLGHENEDSDEQSWGDRSFKHHADPK
ncbi:hypothetical protein ADUPG1_006567 [Aduncisulcus paluster]|uniref:Uncharacterized protein n=1 Tax=Aduncisulcus paluster TaxID=2918883 RepID=A0ABQ5KIP7_9EUKA|nr:hypothetical protein ADUPG1_006567 [Aduncisulcus paluster]